MEKNLQQLFMPVKKVPVKDLLPGYHASKGKDHAIVVTTKQGPKITNLCSEDYGLIPNRELILPLLEMLDNTGLDYETEVNNTNDQRFFVQLIFPKKGINFGYGKKTDLVLPKITWRNSYDLSLKYGLMAGIWRKVCSNGMMAPDQDSFKSLKKLHTVNFSEISLSETLELIMSFLQDSSMIMQPFEILRERIIAMDELEEFVDDIIEYTKFPKRQKEMVLQRILEEKAINNAPNLDGWLIYNGFNFQLNWNDEINMAPHKIQKLDMELVEAISYT